MECSSRTYSLVVERCNGLLGALAALEHNLGNNEGVRLDDFAAVHQSAHRCHRALNVGGRRAGRKVLGQDGVGAGQSANRHTTPRRGRSGALDVDLRCGRGRVEGAREGVGDLAGAFSITTARLRSRAGGRFGAGRVKAGGE